MTQNGNWRERVPLQLFRLSVDWNSSAQNDRLIHIGHPTSLDLSRNCAYKSC